MTDGVRSPWDQTLETLQEVVGSEEFEAWLHPIEFVDFDESNRLVALSVSSDFYQRWITRKYIEQIKAAFEDATGIPVTVQVAVNKPNAVNDIGSTAELESENMPGSVFQNSRQRQADHDTPTYRRTPQPIKPKIERRRLNPRYIFDDFVVGESNRYAHAAAQAVGDSSSQAFNPLFLYGPSGLGKTHLMQAIGHSLIESNPNYNVLYVTSEHFINSFIESIQGKRSFDFRAEYRNVDALLLDDVQFLMGKERTQEEVFHTFNALFESGKKIVLTSDRPPKELTTLEERLRSRFEWGVIADVSHPDLETRMAIIRHKAKIDKLRIPSEVVQYIAEWVTSNVRELEGALKRIRVYSSLHDCPISMEVCREVLSHLAVGQPKPRITIEDIQRVVCQYFEITSVQLLGRNRSKKFSEPRHIALYLCRELTDLSFPDIAQKFGGKDHTSVIYAYRKVKKAIKTDQNTASIIQYLTRQIQQNPSPNA